MFRSFNFHGYPISTILEDTLQYNVLDGVRVIVRAVGEEDVALSRVWEEG